MAEEVRVRLTLDTQGAAASARDVAEQIKRSLGSIKIDNNIIDLGDATVRAQNLTKEILKAKGALTDGKVSQEYQRQAALIQEQIRYRRELQKIDSMGYTAENAATARALAAELNKLNLDKIEQDFNKLSTSATQGLQIIATSAGAVAAAIGTVFAKGVQEFVAFDRQIRASGAIAGASTEELQVLREEVTRLGLETTKTPAEIAQMSVELSRAGFTAEQSAQALEGIVLASEATGESLSTVGDIIAKTLRAFNLSASQSGEVADLLVQTANSTNTSVGGLGDSLKYVSAQAAASNQDLSTVLISLGLLGDAGIQGTQAGTNLAEALNRLKIASAGSVTQFQGLVRGQKGATAAFEAIGAQVRDADGNLKQLTEILPIIRSQISGLAKEDQDVLLKALFGTQGGRAFQTLLNASPDRIAEVSKSVEDAIGSSAEASNKLRQGLGGAISLLESNVTTALQGFGEVAAIPLEPLVRSATAVLSLFNALPAPIKGTLIAITGLAGIILTAIAVTASYRLAKDKLIGSIVKEGIAVTKNTAAEFKNLAVKSALEVKELAWARATGTATAAQNAQIAAIGANIAKIGLLGAAIGAVALAYGSFDAQQQVLADQEAAIDNLNKAITKYKETVADAAEGTPDGAQAQTDAIAANIAELQDKLPPIEQFLDRIRDKLEEIPGPLRKIIPGLAFIADEAEAGGVAVDRQSVKFEELRETVEKDVLGAYDKLKASSDGLAGAAPEELADLKAQLQESITAFEAQAEVSPEAAASVDIYTKALSNAILDIEGVTQSQGELNDETEEGTKKINDQIKALEEQQKAAGQQREDKRADDELALTRRLDDERRGRQEANAESIAAIQEQNAETIAQIEKRNNDEIAAQEKVDAQAIADIEKQNALELQDTERQFEAEITAFEEQRQQALQAKEAAFQRGQQQQEAAFQERQQAIEQQFQEEQRARNEAQTQNFDRAEQLADLEAANTTAQRQNIEQQIRATDRVAELNLADQILSPERINQLARQLAEVGGSVDNEDEARRVQEALGLIRAEQQRQQAEADRVAEEERQAAAQAREAKFQAEQEQRRLVFEEAIAAQRATLEAEIEQRKLDFETNILTPLRTSQEQELALVREEQERNLTTIREQQELELQALRERQETDLENRRRAFEDSERALDRAYEDQKRDRDRQYREQQRLLDRQNEEAIANIRASNRSNPTPVRNDANGPGAFGLRKGGPLPFNPMGAGGLPVQLHKDEFIVPTGPGVVLSQARSRAVVREAIAANPHLIAANLRRGAGVSRAPVRAGGRSQTDDKLLKEMQGLRRDLKQLGRPTENTTLNVGVSDRKSALKEKARQLSNELSRRG